jgi:SOS-response transcriptional repressor LexA
MSGEHLVRVERLRALQRKEGWNDAELARRCKRSQQQIHSWMQNTRMIGERLARSLESTLGLPRYALDERPGVAPPEGGYQDSPQSRGWKDEGRSSTRMAKEVPVIEWADVATMLDTDNSAISTKSRVLQTFAATSSSAKFLVMPDDSMAPDISLGDHLLFDPREAPRAGDVVLVRCGSEFFVRIFRPRTAYVFEALARNANYQPLDSTDEFILVMAVLVEHRKYRRTGG